MGLGDLKDAIVRKLALRWLHGKADDLRGKDKESTMGKVLKFLDGWKLVIGVIVLFGVKVFDAANNGHTGDVIGSVLSALGWLPGAQSGFTVEGITVAAASGLAVWGFIMKLVKAQQQLKAGAPVHALLSEQGYVTKYVADAVKAGKLEDIQEPPVKPAV
jgi:hypothetical protein